MRTTAALLVTVSLALLRAQPFTPNLPGATAAPSNNPGTVDGSVTNYVTGDPVRKAVVTVQGAGSNMQTTTDVAGHFHFDKIVPGSYQINASRDGFLNVPERHPKTVKVGEGENIKDVTVALLPLARVSGHVFDDDGEPIMLAGIQALRYGYNQGRKQFMPGGFATSNDLGEFQFSDLEPGKYVFIVNARPAAQSLPPRTRFIGQLTAYPPTYYPSVSDPNQATPAEIAPGAALTSIDFRLRKVPAFHVRGTLVDSAGQPVRNANISLSETAVRVANVRNFARVLDDGTFDIPAVTPGTYLLTATRPQPNGSRSEYLTERITVSDQDLDGVAPVLSNGTPISARFNVEGPAPADINSNMYLLSTEGFGRSFPGVKQPDGTVLIDNVQPGSYSIDIFLQASGLYVKSIRFGDTDVSSGELTVTQGSTLPLNIALGTDGGQVEGTIQTASGAPAASVSLVPASDLSGRRDLVKQTGSDPQGNFKFVDVAPGEYKVYAWQESVPDVIDVVEFRKALESKAASVTVQPGGRESVQVQVISADEVEAAKSRLP